MGRKPSANDGDTLVEAKRTKLGVVEARTSAPAIVEDLSGQVIGGYLIESQVGAGAMGVVYRAKHIDTNRVVALKSLRPDLVQNTKAVERFRREATFASRVAHPHIGGVVELVEADGRALIAYEFVEGEPLTAIMTMPLPPERVMLITAQILRGLEHAHAQDLIHRDLKPDNVLVEWRNQRDHARIVDFGIATIREDSEDAMEPLTATGEVVGTPLYMAPEQAAGKAIDHRVDLYSLGMIVYEMLVGMAPFHGRPIEILHAKLRRDPPTFADIAPALIVEPMLERFCRKLLARRPAERFQSARQALYVLKLVETTPAAAGPALGIMDVEKALAVVSLPEPPPPKKKKR